MTLSMFVKRLYDFIEDKKKKRKKKKIWKWVCQVLTEW